MYVLSLTKIIDFTSNGRSFSVYFPAEYWIAPPIATHFFYLFIFPLSGNRLTLLIGLPTNKLFILNIFTRTILRIKYGFESFELTNNLIVTCLSIGIYKLTCFCKIVFAFRFFFALSHSHSIVSISFADFILFQHLRSVIGSMRRVFHDLSTIRTIRW